MTAPTSTWLSRLRALTVAERPALVDEMSEGEAKMCLLRLQHRLDRIQGALSELSEATEDWFAPTLAGPGATVIGGREYARIRGRIDLARLNAIDVLEEDK